MIIQIAVADAYGAAYEFSPKPPPNDLKYHVHPSRKEDLCIGEYTDDTQMTLAIMRHLISGKPWNQHNIAWFFLNEYKNYPIDGYARGFQTFLDECKSAQQFTANIKPQSNRNGSVMRSVPVGVLLTVEDVVNYSYIQSSVTHATVNACHAAAAVALASHYFYYDLGTPKGVSVYLKKTIGFDLQRTYTKVACDALETAHAAIYIAKTITDIDEAMKAAVDLGGDTDSVASVAAGIISMRDGLMPSKHLFDELSSRGRRSAVNMVALEAKLFEKYPWG